jgi:hypothetical protein
MSDTQESLRVDSLVVLYHGLQICRHGRQDYLTRMIRHLQSLHTILAAVLRRDAFVIPVDSAVVDGIPGCVARDDTARAELPSLSPRQRVVVAFVQILVAEFVRLAQSWNIAALRGLGYQFHNLPAALRVDRPYDRSTDSGSFRVAAAHWDELSWEMRTAFCQYVGVDPSDAERLVRSNGFADTMEY